VALSLLAALWQAGHEAGDFILPALLATVAAAVAILAEPRNWEIAPSPCAAPWRASRWPRRRRPAGFVAGYSPATLRLARPLSR
jgi:hypothetical protein